MKHYKITPEFKEAIRNSGLSLNTLSKILGFEVRNVIYKNSSIREDYLDKLKDLLKLNIRLSEIDINYNPFSLNLEIIKKINQIKESEELAEFIGIMLGDGNFYENQIKVSFDSRDENYIQYVKNLIYNLISIEVKGFKEKGRNGFRLYCCNSKFAEKLTEFGLMRGDKIKNKIGIPQWVKDNPGYAKKCIKGLVDTDGCLIFCKRDNQISVNFTSKNKNLLQDFKELALSLGYHFAKANQNNIRLYRKTEVARFINDIKPFKDKGL